MRKIGQLISTFRSDKGISQAALAKDIMSPAQISKFEHGLTSITVDKFFLLLDRLNVSPQEFDFELYHGDAPNKNKMIADLTQAVISGNKSQCELIKQAALKTYERDNCGANKALLLMINALMTKLDHSAFDQDSVDYLCDYLFHVEHWSSFEFLIYGTTMNVLPLPTINLFSQDLISRAVPSAEIQQNFELIIVLLYNTVRLNLMNNDLLKAQYYMRSMENINFGGGGGTNAGKVLY
ncbi:helix-turn-helix domain-containing protein [Lapidilactobacillus luobeiensis]|uniref:helix-turn-helix domain-containing protein n=1 Tax=Lapidilactobacillus luobeiensis TaxID=2950371 RepID=UPI0021C35E9D|nr:Rgg/GadR/MutR family transcriptional regulator [Lapidilactobacillus luobeiensis]